MSAKHLYNGVDDFHRNVRVMVDVGQGGSNISCILLESACFCVEHTLCPQMIFECNGKIWSPYLIVAHTIVAV